MENLGRLLSAQLAGVALTSCAPIILGRTPQPAAPGAFEFSLNAGYPLLSPYPNDPFNGPTQAPFAQPLNLFLSRGVGSDTEVNGTLSVNILPSLRLGDKTLLVSGSVPLAVIFGTVTPQKKIQGYTCGSLGVGRGRHESRTRAPG